MRPTISVTMANKGKVAKDGCTRYYKSREGGKSVRQGRGTAIIRRPLGPTIRPRSGPRAGPAVATSQSYRNSIVSRIALNHHRGITWRGQTSRSIRDHRPLSARERRSVFAVFAERRYFRVSSGYGRKRHRRRVRPPGTMCFARDTDFPDRFCGCRVDLS